ncbi:DoxX family protein [Knoellia sp. Soil729]|uniref:DoxX family protein n=1 Tax=Knoellia sp. Soil729 TaxID=1736394 RepID=UPI000700CEBA|nr:MauE/DoxX family redox-associated membrane protein [Knoellia sp. Soil729]KRE41877.1 DoxX family protein [Knoellia sp. Soil729]
MPVTPRTIPPLDKATIGLATLFLSSGATHLVRPQTFEGMVPDALPRRRELVFVSGVAEIVCGVGLLHPRTRKAAGLASAVLLVAVFPGNVKMSTDHAKRAQRKGDTGSKAFLAATIARLPMQWPLIRTALRAAGRH